MASRGLRKDIINLKPIGGIRLMRLFDGKQF